MMKPITPEMETAIDRIKKARRALAKSSQAVSELKTQVASATKKADDAGMELEQAVRDSEHLRLLADVLADEWTPPVEATA